jgi:hypothetical protein
MALAIGSFNDFWSSRDAGFLLLEEYNEYQISEGSKTGILRHRRTKMMWDFV